MHLKEIRPASNQKIKSVDVKQICRFTVVKLMQIKYTASNLKLNLEALQHF